MKFERQTLDVTDGAKVEDAVARAEAELVVNSAAYNQVDIAEKEPAAAFQAMRWQYAISLWPVASPARSWFTIQTDYVFDGTKGTAYVGD